MKLLRLLQAHFAAKELPPAGLEPAIFGLEVQRLIHWATGAHTKKLQKVTQLLKITCIIQQHRDLAKISLVEMDQRYLPSMGD